MFSVHPGLLPIGLSETGIVGPRAADSYAGRIRSWVMRELREGRGADPESALELIMFLATGRGDALSGRHVSVHDDTEAMLAHIDEIRDHDLYVMRPERLERAGAAARMCMNDRTTSKGGAMRATSYAAGTDAEPLLRETIGANLAHTISTFPDRDALIVPFQDVRYTYREFGAEVDRVARALLARGLATGDRVGIWSPNCAEWVVLQYATAAVGVILVNINPAYRAYELAYVVEQSGCRVLFAATEFKTSDYRAMVDEVAPDLAALEQVVYLGTPDWDAFVGRADEVDADTVARRAAELSFDDPINIQYTSGTTGFPKGATLSHHNILNNGYFTGEVCAYTEADRVCIPVPLYHCFGMVLGNLACTTHGAAMVLPAPGFEPRATLETVAAERCTSLYGVPTMFIAELDLDDFSAYELSSLRTGIMAGAPCPVEVMKRCVSDMHMEAVTIAYGMTETSPVSTQTAGDDPIDQRVGTVGRVHPHVEIKIVDPDGNTVERGEAGEFCTRGYSVMIGYWNDPERTSEAIDADALDAYG